MANPALNFNSKPQNSQNLKFDNRLKQIYQMATTGQNSAQIMNMLPPQVRQMLSMCNGNYQQAFNFMCQQRGVNPQQFIQQLSNFLKS